MTFRDRDQMLNRGEALVIVRKNVNGHFVPDWSEIVITFEPSDSEFHPRSLDGPSLAHTVRANDIVRAIVKGERPSMLFVEAYAILESRRWQELTREYEGDLADFWRGRAIFAHARGGNLRSYPHKRIYERGLYRVWEKVLKRFDLHDQAIRSNGWHQWIIPEGTAPPLTLCQENSQLAARYGIEWNTCQAVKVIPHKREVPEWTQSDERLREFLQHRYLSAFREVGPRTDPTSRKGIIRGHARRRAAELAVLLYMAFRPLWPYSQIAEEVHIDPAHAVKTADDARKHGNRYFAGERCCRNTRLAPRTLSLTNPGRTRGTPRFRWGRAKLTPLAPP